jgi:hypothetical protein
MPDEVFQITETAVVAVNGEFRRRHYLPLSTPAFASPWTIIIGGGSGFTFGILKNSRRWSSPPRVSATAGHFNPVCEHCLVGDPFIALTIDKYGR